MTTLIASDEQRVNELCDQLLAEHDPKTTPAGRVPRRAVRPRARRGCTSRKATAASASRRSCRTRSTRKLSSAPARRSPYARNPDRVRHVRADDRHARYRRAEAAVPAAVVHRRRDLVPAVQRAGGRLRRRRASRCARCATATSGSVNGQKVWTTLAHVSRVRHRARAHRSRHGEAQGHDDVRRRHARARRRGPAARAGDR